MITATNNDSNTAALKTLWETSYNLKTGIGCTIEYNINSMINNPTVEGPSIIATSPFKKLFPVDSIAKANRPAVAGIKYYVLGDALPKDWTNPKSVSYPKDFRLYIPGANLAYKYYISAIGASETLSITYPKKVFVNKITVKFENSHSEPTTFSIYGTAFGGAESLLKTGSASNIPDISSDNAGLVNIYYTGTAWSFLESDLNLSAHVELSAIKLTFTAPSNKYVGVIEVAPKYVIDITNDLTDFTINKETTSNE